MNSDLYSAVAPVRHDDIVVVVHSNAGRGIELPVTFAMAAERVQELAFGVEYLWRKK